MESNRGHAIVNILMKHWIVYDDYLLWCVRRGTWPRGGKVHSKVTDGMSISGHLFTVLAYSRLNVQKTCRHAGQSASHVGFGPRSHWV